MLRPLLVLIIMLLGVTSAAQQSARTVQGKTLKIVPLVRTNPSSGAEMYQSYCASCHGTYGKGNGPAADFLKTPPPDLTQLTKQNQGKYPVYRVLATLKGRNVHQEAALNMPDWTRLFHSLNLDRAITDMRVQTLTTYVESMQE